MSLTHLALCALAAVTASSGSVLLVDAASGPYFDIQSAVDASPAGDVVLVRSGNYPPFAVVARSITVAADTGANVLVQGAVRARNSTADQTLVLSGLRAQGELGISTETNGLRVTDCAGSIRVQDCEFFGANDLGSCAVPPPEGAAAGARIRMSPDVLIARSLIVGGRLPGGYFSSQLTPPSGSGLEVESSRVALQQVVARGLYGGHGCPDASSGGHGAVLRSNAELHAQLCGFEGGNGGHGQNIGAFAYGGSGGSGLWLQPTCPSTSLARLMSCTFQPGQYGVGHCAIFCGGETYSGWPGQPTVVHPCASSVGLGGIAPTLDCAGVVRESMLLTLTLTGAPLDRIWLRIAFDTAHEWIPSKNGVQLVEDASARWLLVAELGASGQATFTQPMSNLRVGEQARVLHMQVLAQRPDGSLQLGFARSLVILDSAL